MVITSAQPRLKEPEPGGTKVSRETIFLFWPEQKTKKKLIWA